MKNYQKCNQEKVSPLRLIRTSRGLELVYIEKRTYYSD